MASCEKTNSDAIKLNYDQYNPFVLCGETLTPIYRGTASVVCSFCKTSYKPELKGNVCKICGICEVGAEASGLRHLNEKQR